MARYGDDTNRDRWRNDDRERSSWRDRDDNRGFLERAGDEVRSWFSDDDRRDQDFERSRSRWDRDRETSRSGMPRSSSWDRDQNRSSFSDRDRGFGPDERSSFGGMAQNGYGRSNEGYGRDRERFGRSNLGGLRDESDLRSQHRGNPQSWSEANRGQSDWERDRNRGIGGAQLGLGEFSGTLGGFGNQTFGSSQDDHYRTWRDRQMAELDKDYEDYCRERENQFHQDFDSWRRSRSSRSPLAAGNASSADLGAASNAGVGTTTSSVTGTAGAGSAIGSATGAGGSIQSDTAGSTETASAGGSRSGSRSRS